MLQTVVLNVTSACPNRCPACFVDKKNPLQMNLESFCTLIDKFLDVKPNITLSGGDPFMHPDLPAMTRQVASLIDKPAVFTSGIYNFLNTFDLSELADSVKFFNVTLKFPLAKLNDSFFGTKHLTMNAIDFISKSRKEYDIPVNIQFAVDRRNVVYFDTLYRMSHEMDANIHILRYFPFAGDYDVALTDEEWESFVENVYEKDRVWVMAPSKKTYLSCVAGVTRIAVNPNFDVTPCLYLAGMPIVNFLDQQVCSKCDVPLLDGICPFCGGTSTKKRSLSLEEVMNVLWGWRNNFPEKCCVADMLARKKV